MNNRRYVMQTIILGLILAPAAAVTGDALTPDLTLREIMQGLRDNYVQIADGLLTENFDLIAYGASGIAGHPKIATDQVKLVAAELGADMPSFKQLDRRVHELAVAIKAAAETGNRDAALGSYQQMTESCVACHAVYKERVARALK